MRRPTRSERRERFRCGHLPQPVGQTKTVAHTEVVDGQDVGSAETEYEHHLDSPAADAADLCQASDDLLVAQRTQRLVVRDNARECLLREIAQRGDLREGEPGCAECGLRRGENGCGCWKQAFLAAAVNETGQDRARRRSIELLVRNRLSECLEGRAIRLHRHRGRTYRANDTTKNGVDGRQVGDRKLAHGRPFPDSRSAISGRSGNSTLSAGLASAVVWLRGTCDMAFPRARTRTTSGGNIPASRQLPRSRVT